MTHLIEKVTAFITRQAANGRELLLFEHPYAGIQIPAGTVKNGESPETAVLREAAEETGLRDLSIQGYLGSTEWHLPEGQNLILVPTTVYARPDLGSFDWAHLRRGILVKQLRRSGEFVQVSYEEFDQELDPQYVTMNITGWVPEWTLAGTARRHFFQLAFHGQSGDRWKVHTDNHQFTLFWAPLTDLPAITPPQNTWLAFLKNIPLNRAVHE